MVLLQVVCRPDFEKANYIEARDTVKGCGSWMLSVLMMAFSHCQVKKCPLWSWVNLWLIHADVLQKPTQYCKAIILQLKINKTKKNPLCQLLAHLIQMNFSTYSRWCIKTVLWWRFTKGMWIRSHFRFVRTSSHMTGTLPMGGTPIHFRSGYHCLDIYHQMQP